MQTRRTQRVADLILQEAAGILQKDVKDPRVGFVTLTGVTVAADLRSAKIFYTVLGEEANREASARGLASATPFVRREIAHRLRLRAAPEIRFLYDDSIEKTLHLQEMLEEISHGPDESDR